MKMAVIGVVVFAFLLVAGESIPARVAESLRMLVWGVAFLSLSSTAKVWLTNRRPAHTRPEHRAAVMVGLEASRIR